MHVSSKDISIRCLEDSYIINKYFDNCMIAWCSPTKHLARVLFHSAENSLNSTTASWTGLLCATVPVWNALCQLSIHTPHICNIFKISSRLLHTSYTEISCIKMAQKHLFPQVWCLYFSLLQEQRMFSFKLNLSRKAIRSLLKKCWQDQTLFMWGN